MEKNSEQSENSGRHIAVLSVSSAEDRPVQWSVSEVEMWINVVS